MKMRNRDWKIILLVFSCMLVFSSCFAGAGVTAPTELRIPVMSYDSSSAALFWSRPAKGESVAYYQVYANGKLIGDTKMPQASVGTKDIQKFATANPGLVGNLIAFHSYKATGLQPDTDYTFTVRAVDQNGAVSADSAAVKIHTAAVEKVIKLTDFGAVADGKTVNTAALQKAIDACPTNGILEVPAGTFVSGAVQLKSDMTLQLDEGAVLLSSENVEDYAMGSNGRYIGMLNGDGIQNVRIVGAGIIDGNGWQMDGKGKYLKAKNVENKGMMGDNHVLNIGILAKNQTQAGLDAGDNLKKAYNSRSTTVILRHMKNLYIDGVTLRNPAMHMLTVEADNVTLNNVNVKTYDANNGDGIDFDGKNLLVANSYFDTGDDAINFSAGIGAKGTQDPPVSDIWLFNNYIAHGHGGVVCGSHTASWIQNLLAEDNVFDKTEISLRCKTGQGVGGGARNVIFRNSVAKDMKRQGIIFTTAYTDVNAVGTFEAAATGQFHDILVEDCNIDGTGGAAVEINGTSEMPHKNITVRNVHFTRTHENKIANAENCVFENVTYDTVAKK